MRCFYREISLSDATLDNDVWVYGGSERSKISKTKKIKQQKKIEPVPKALMTNFEGDV